MNRLQGYFLHVDFQGGECLALFTGHVSLNSLKPKVKREDLADKTSENACAVCCVPGQKSAVLRHEFESIVAYLISLLCIVTI